MLSLESWKGLWCVSLDIKRKDDQIFDVYCNGVCIFPGHWEHPTGQESLHRCPTTLWYSPVMWKTGSPCLREANTICRWSKSCLGAICEKMKRQKLCNWIDISWWTFYFWISVYWTKSWCTCLRACNISTWALHIHMYCYNTFKQVWEAWFLFYELWWNTVVEYNKQTVNL